MPAPTPVRHRPSPVSSPGPGRRPASPRPAPAPWRRDRRTPAAPSSPPAAARSGNPRHDGDVQRRDGLGSSASPGRRSRCRRRPGSAGGGRGPLQLRLRPSRRACANSALALTSVVDRRLLAVDQLAVHRHQADGHLACRRCRRRAPPALRRGSARSARRRRVASQPRLLTSRPVGRLDEVDLVEHLVERVGG